MKSQMDVVVTSGYEFGERYFLTQRLVIQYK